MATERSMGVQFCGVPQVVRAFKNSGVAAWSVCCGSDLIHAYEGTNIDEAIKELQQFLDELAEGNSKAYYSLRVYNSVPPDGEIKPKTEWSRSFKFQLSEERISGYSGGVYREVMERLDKIDARLAVDDEDRTDERKIDGIGNFLNGLMENENVKNALGQGIAKIIEIVTKPFLTMDQPQYNTQPAAIGNPGGELAPDQIDKVQRAIADLIQVDNRLGDHLEKIAAIAKRDGAKYRNLVAMLNIL